MMLQCFETSLAYRRKEGRMRAIDVMTSQIVTATPQSTVQDAAKLMINNRAAVFPL
jgi:CBS domain-containing protein